VKRALALVLLAASAHAEPLRLRADALATTASPAGLLTLEAEGQAHENVSAEAVVWMNGTEEDSTGDVLVVAVRAHTPGNRVGARFGRFVSTLGALRANHVDGAAVRVHLPYQFDVEGVGGVPVMPGLATSRSWDWLVGGRVSHQIGDAGSAGLAYMQRRDDGRLYTEELGADAGFAINKRDDVGARAAYDVVNPGIAEIAVTASHRTPRLRSEVYAIHREASHLLPATSLFSVIGDVPSQRAGAVTTWRIARLDLIADLGARRVDNDYGAELAGRANLRLDDKGTSMLGGEIRRSGVGDEMWTGLRGTARIALGRGFTASSELELVIPDVDHHKGRVWPWALGALSYETGDWQAAIAAEASSTPEYAKRFDVLAQVARRWGRK